MNEDKFNYNVSALSITLLFFDHFYDSLRLELLIFNFCFPFLITFCTFLFDVLHREHGGNMLDDNTSCASSFLGCSRVPPQPPTFPSFPTIHYTHVQYYGLYFYLRPTTRAHSLFASLPPRHHAFCMFCMMMLMIYHRRLKFIRFTREPNRCNAKTHNHN